MRRREAGFSAVELVVVSTMIGLLVSVAVPKFTMARSTAETGDATIAPLRASDPRDI